MARKIVAIVPSALLVFMLVCGPVMADAHPAFADNHNEMDNGMNMDADCAHDDGAMDDQMPAGHAGHHDMNGSACCSIVCQGFALTAPSITPPLFAVATASTSYAHFIPVKQSTPLYHPPKA